jgi:putative ABC transport system permease protein
LGEFYRNAEAAVAVAAIHPQTGVEFTVLTERIQQSLMRDRLMALLAGAFGLLAGTLAVLGLYGVISYMVARRRKEIGIRMALGAEQARVPRMVLREVAIFLVAGLALGLAVAVFSTRLLASFLYRLEPNDPTTLVTACVVLAVSALVAGPLPARRAANLDPMMALCEE